MHDLWSQLEDGQNQENPASQNDAAASAVESDLAAGPAITSHQRRPSERMVITRLRTWLLDNYVPSYCRTLGSTRIYRRCYWIDALGAEKKQLLLSAPAQESRPEKRTKKVRANGRASADISNVPPILQPLTALAEQLRQGAQPIKLQGLILEAGSSRSKRSHPFNAPGLNAEGQGEIIHASWLEAAPSLLTQIDQSPAIFLLNPFSATLFSNEDLAAIAQRTAPTELLLLISHKQLATHLRTARRNTQVGQTLTALLRSDRWKSLVPASADPGKAPQTGEVIALLLKAIQRQFPLTRCIDFQVQASPISLKGAPYSLLFATRRQDSLASMNDATCLYQRQLVELGRRGVLGETWFADREQQRRIEERAQLRQRILTQGQAQRVRRWPDLRQYFLLNNFGQFMLQDYDEMILELWSEGIVKIQWRQPQKQDEPARPPGNEDTLLWK